MSLQRIYYFAILLMGLMACTSTDDLDSSPDVDLGDTDRVYMTISNQALSSSFTTRTSGIDLDKIEHDIHGRLRVLAFNRRSGQLIYNRIVRVDNQNTSEAFPIEAGIVDFVYIGNENSIAGLTSRLENLTRRSDFDAIESVALAPFFLKGTQPLEHYQNNGFLMYATYYNINVPKPVAGGVGSSSDNPWPFRGSEGKINLSKAFAKVELKLQNPYVDANNQPVEPARKIKKVELVNTLENASFPSKGEIQSQADQTLSISEFDGIFDYTKAEVGTLVGYIPEYLVGSNASNTTQLVITLSNDEVKTVPLYSRFVNDQGSISNDYIAQFAQLDGVEPGYDSTQAQYNDHSVVRNLLYRTTANLTGDFEIGFDVEDWIPVEYNQEWKPEDAYPAVSRIIVSNFQWTPADRLLNATTNEVTVSFNIERALNNVDGQSVEASNIKWRFGLTNGAEFKVTEGPHIGTANTPYMLTIKPRKGQGSHARNTKVDFYVNNTLIKPSMIYDLRGYPLFQGDTSDKFVITQSAK